MPKPYHQYALDVGSGEVLTCSWVRLACKRYLSDLENADKLGIYFDLKAVEKVFKFFKLLKFTKGEWTGQTFKLEAWQQFILANVFGWKNVSDDSRRFRYFYLETARKSGKTELLAGIGLYMTSADREGGAEVYSIATKLDQARISHSAATMMVRKSAELSNIIKVYKNNLHVVETGSKFEPLGSDSKTLDGLNVSAGLVDELHAHKTRDLWEVIITATGARKQPLIAAITTAGFNKQSICWEQHDYTEKVLEGLINDETHFGIIYTLDLGDKDKGIPDDDWEDESLWRKANPNLNVCTKLDDLRMKAKKAKEVPTALNSFLRLHMNIWTDSVTKWISTEKWGACAVDRHIEELKGRTCYAGLDLSSNIDLSALVLIFPPIAEGERYKLFSFFWCPKDNIQDRVKKDRVPYDTWVRQGHITATPGASVDYNFILERLSQLGQDFDLLEVAYDKWGASKLVNDLIDAGFELENVKHAPRHLIQFAQNISSMSGPTKEFEKMVISREIEHDNNPVMNWNLSNTVIRFDASGNMKPDKAASTEKIDGVVSAIMALDRAVGDEGGSIYEDRSLLTL